MCTEAFGVWDDNEFITDPQVTKNTYNTFVCWERHDKDYKCPKVCELEEENENLAYENKRMGDFLGFLGLTPCDITDFVIHGGDWKSMRDQIKSRDTDLQGKYDRNDWLNKFVVDTKDNKKYKVVSVCPNENELAKCVVDDIYKRLRLMESSDLDTEPKEPKFNVGKLPTNIKE